MVLRPVTRALLDIPPWKRTIHRQEVHPIAVIAGFLADLMTIPFRMEIPESCSRVKDLVRYVGSLDPRVWSKEAVFVKLREIIVEQLGVKESQVTLEAHFVNDLLMD